MRPRRNSGERRPARLIGIEAAARNPKHRLRHADESGGDRGTREGWGIGKRRLGRLETLTDRTRRGFCRGTGKFGGKRFFAALGGKAEGRVVMKP
jgi:hypothetical protein